jgi:hypothetical protein
MFGSSIFDTLLGVVFVFLLVSMLVTIINEMIAAAMRSRAAWLRTGIERLLGSAWATKLYDHPLVYGTAHSREEKPSYIPSRSFANVLMDLIRDANTAVTATRDALQAALVPAGDTGVTVDQLRQALQKAAVNAAEAKGAGARMAADMALLRESLPATVGDAIREVQKFIDALPAGYVRESIASIEPDRIRIPLLALYDDAQNDVEKFKQNVEIWFNNAMDRVSGWYKRRAQWVTLGLGLLLAVLLNIDTIAIARYLQAEPVARDALVAEAAAYARTAQPVPASHAGNSPLCAANAGKDESGKPCPPKGAPGAGGSEAGEDPAQMEARFAAVRAELDKLHLPIGWTWTAPASARQPGQQGQAAPAVQPAKPATKPAVESGQEIPTSMDALQATLMTHLLGWLVTALAATLGAPFWFDTLNRMISIRSAGKSPEEAPKAPKEVPVPLEPGQTPKEAERNRAGKQD